MGGAASKRCCRRESYHTVRPRTRDENISAERRERLPEAARPSEVSLPARENSANGAPLCAVTPFFS